jgi:hypothetical protein
LLPLLLEPPADLLEPLLPLLDFELLHAARASPAAVIAAMTAADFL